MKSLHYLADLKFENIDSAYPSDKSFSPSKFNLHSVRYLKISEDTIPSTSSIKLREKQTIPDNKQPYFRKNREDTQRKSTAGHYSDLSNKGDITHERASSELDEAKFFKPVSENKNPTPLSKLRIVPEVSVPSQKSKLYCPTEQISPFGKKHHPLQKTKPYKQSNRERQEFKDSKDIKLQANELVDTVDRRHSFYNCKLAESYADNSLNPTSQFRIEESAVFERSVLQSFLILSKSQMKANKYYEMIGIQRQIGLAVSLKCIDSSQLEQICNEIKIYRAIGEDCVHVVKNYAGLLERNEYIFIREYYEIPLRDMLYRFNEDNIKDLLKQMLTLFEYFTSIKLVYKGDFFTNVCYHRGLYKLRNFQESSIKKDASESSLRRKYLGVLREMMRVLLGIDNSKPYYSKKLKRELRPNTMVFLNDLIKNGMGFQQLKEHAFLNK